MGKKVDMEQPIELQKFVDVPLFDMNGRAWRISTRSRRQLFSKKKIFVLEELKFSSEELLSTIFQKLFHQAFGKWIAEDVKPFLGNLVKEADPLIQQCLKEGGANFRKEFITKLGVQGEAIWKNLLDEQLQEIEKLSNGGKKEDNSKFITSIMLPPQVRLYRSIVNNNSLYEFFLFECPPQKRMIYYGRDDPIRIKLSFPWILFLVGFVNKELGYIPWTHLGDGQTYAGSRAFWVFYRSLPLENENDTVVLSNLPNGSRNPPYSWCLGLDVPHISLEDPLWHQKIFNWFWDSKFNSGWNYPNSRQVIFFDEWKKMSKDQPDKVIELPWQKIPGSIGSFIDEMAEEFERQEGQENISKKKRLAEKQLAEKKKQLSQKFRERLEEELFFLGGHLSIPVETKKKALEFLQEKLEKGSVKLSSDLEELGNAAGKETSETIKANHIRKAIK